MKYQKLSHTSRSTSLTCGTEGCRMHPVRTCTPNHLLQRYARMEAQSEYACIACTLSCASGTDLRARPVLVDKISASELSRKCVKSELLVGSSGCC